MCSAFLIFDLVGRNVAAEYERCCQSLISPKLNDSNKAVGLVVGEESEPSSGG
jgi:hypothetical protein